MQCVFGVSRGWSLVAWSSRLYLRRVPRRVLGLALIIGSLGASAPPVAAQGGAFPELRMPGMQVRLSRVGGHIEALRDGDGRQLAGVAADSVGLWSIDLSPGSSPARITAAQAGRFDWRRGAQGSLVLTWDRFGPASPALRVTATVRARADTTSAWTITLDGIDGVAVEQLRFPRVTGITALGEAEELAVPLWMGQRTREPRRLLAGADGRGRRLEWSYPGQLSLQAISWTSPGRGGLYFAADDTLAYRKLFALWGEGDGAAGYEVVHALSDPGRNARYAPAYAAVVGVVDGDWFSAAERYRKWGTRQYWARTSRFATGKTPAWIGNTGIWVWNRGRSNVVLEPAAALQADAGLPVSVFWHWWHNGPYDTSFPDYLPPREGAVPFTAAVQKAHDAGLHAIVYMNQRLWCVDTPSWTAEDAERWAVRERDGQVRKETYNVFDPLPCAPMDVATPFWRNKYAGIADTVIHQYKLDGLYMDQAVLSLACWSPDHGHPLGGGHYWMDGFRELARDLRRRGGALPLGFAGEGGGESWLPDLDAFLTLQVSQERYIDPASGWEVLPLFQAVYHPYAVTYGTYGSLTWPPYDDLWPVASRPANAMTLLDTKYRRQYLLEQARMFVWGMQPTIANFLPEQLTARRSEIDYLERLARLRYGLREFFQGGVMLRAPAVTVDSADVLMSRVSIYAARRGGATEATVRSPMVLAGAWRSSKGQVAIGLASITDEAREVTVQLDARMYALREGARIVRVDAEGRRTPIGRVARGAQAISLTLPGLSGTVLIVE
ncbi:MAG: hypothetical protein IT360_10000 [Gemmatimonadaceae bacterium]|nr:hypothetical protein [Gemmatimonadaceae bacterium]